MWDIDLRIPILTEAEPISNIGILWSTACHVQCLNSQQLFYYIISLNKKQQEQQNLGHGLCLGQS